MSLAAQQSIHVWKIATGVTLHEASGAGALFFTRYVTQTDSFGCAYLYSLFTTNTTLCIV